MESGTQVRLTSNPGQVGVLTGRSREQGPITKLQVQFPDNAQYVPADQLEVVDNGPEDPIDLLKAGKVGEVADLRRILTHVRLTGRLSDLIYSLETTNTDFYAYQYKPVLKMLESPNQGLLIADEVGLGKTIEAGLIWTELRSRFDFRRMLVVCPAMLREKWRKELAHRFGVDAEILKADETLSRLQQATKKGPHAEFAIVASVQGLRQTKGNKATKQLSDFLKDHAYEEPIVDFLIVDEAHYMRNPESKNAKLGHQLRRVSSHVALLSATPVHLGSEDLFQLLNLLDEDTFQRQEAFDRILKANEPLIDARDQVLRDRVPAETLRGKLQEAMRNPLLGDNRQLRDLLGDLPEDGRIKEHERRSRIAHRLERVNLLSHTVTRTQRREVEELRVERNATPEKVPLTDSEQDFYQKVTGLVRDYCSRRNAHEGFLLVMPQRQMSSSMPAALRSWQERAAAHWDEQAYEDLGIDEEYEDEDIGPLTKELLRRAPKLGDLDALWENDSKYERLRDVLTEYVRKYPAEKIIVFSYFRPTLRYLSERLEKDGFSTIVLKGGQDQDKEEVLEDFEDPDGPQILLSSEVGSEGIDLQFSRVVINYDLPWNPMKVEQRIGRVDRLGQEADQIYVWNLFCANTIDARIHDRLFRRLKIFERALGSIEPVLGEEIRELTVDLLSGQLSAEEEEKRIDQAAQAIEYRNQQKQQLEEQAAHLIAHGDYILDQVRTSRNLNRWVTGQDIRAYVMNYMQSNYPGCDFQRLTEEEEEYDIELSNEAQFELDTFLDEHPQYDSTLLTSTKPGPVRCRFDRNVAADGGAGVEVINHFHPLVRFVSAQIDQATGGQHPAVALTVSASRLKTGVSPGVYVFSVQRWSIEGIQSQEKLDYRAIPLQGEKGLLQDEWAEDLVVTAATEGRTWMGASSTVDWTEAGEWAWNRCLSASSEAYEEFVRQLENRNEDRADTQEQTLRDHLKNQRERLREIKRGHLREGRDPLAKATQGRIDKLENRVERELLRIEKQRELDHKHEDICVGVIEVR